MNIVSTCQVHFKIKNVELIPNFLTLHSLVSKHSKIGNLLSGVDSTSITILLQRMIGNH